jgi:hypothetical protein
MATAYEEYQQMCAELDSLRQQVTALEARNKELEALAEQPKERQEKNYISATTADNLIKIRNVFKPAVSDLANIFGVSRQAIYNWIAGDEPIDAHAQKIKDLASAADLAIESGAVITSHVLKRKIVSGKSFFELVNSGESAHDSMLGLLQMLTRETDQRKQIEQRLARRAQPRIDSQDIGLLVINEIG